MKIQKFLSIIGIASLSFFYSCKEEKKEQVSEQQAPPVITNNDIEQARILTLSNPLIDSTWEIDSSNVGYGQRQDFNADSANNRTK